MDKITIRICAVGFFLVATVFILSRPNIHDKTSDIKSEVITDESSGNHQEKLETNTNNLTSSQPINSSQENQENQAAIVETNNEEAIPESNPILTPTEEPWPREREVLMVWFSAGRNKGGTSPLTVRVRKNHTREVGVAFMEEFIGGAGDSMRSAGWAAAFHAAHYRNESLADYEFQFRTGGLADGSSASMLTTTATLAALEGVPLIADTTMTGTINPDGTCGPVGGIKYKMKGAAESGIKRFGIPIGARLEKDSNDDIVDLVSYGKNLGLLVKEIKDMEAAYEWMTGVKIDKSNAIPDTEQLSLSGSLFDNLRAECEELTRMLTSERDELQGHLGKVSAESLTVATRSLIADLQQTWVEAEKFMDDGQIVAAYLRLQQVKTILFLLKYSDDLITLRHGKQNFSEIISRMRSQIEEIDQSVSSSELKLRALSNSVSVEQGVDICNALIRLAEVKAIQAAALRKQYKLSNFANAIVELENRNDKTRQDIETLKELNKSLSEMVITTKEGVTSYLALINMKLSMIHSVTWQRTSNSDKHLIDKDVLDMYWKAYVACGSASVSYFESVVIESTAEQTGLSSSSVVRQLDDRDPRLGSMLVGRDQLYGISLNAKDTKSYFDYLVALGAGMSSYLSASEFLNSYYALGVSGVGDVREVDDLRALGNMIDFSRAKVEKKSLRIQEIIGCVPESIIINYQLGESLRNGSSTDKLSALSAYWRAAVLCDFAEGMTDSPINQIKNN